MAKPKITVQTEVGTFSRQTARTYTHVVVVKGYKAELMEATRLEEIRYAQKELAKYEELAAGGEAAVQAYRTKERYGDWLDLAYVLKAITTTKEHLAAKQAQGPITQDRGDKFEVLGWCGRPDLAMATARGKQAAGYREVRIYAVTGERVL